MFNPRISHALLCSLLFCVVGCDSSHDSNNNVVNYNFGLQWSATYPTNDLFVFEMVDIEYPDIFNKNGSLKISAMNKDGSQVNELVSGKVPPFFPKLVAGSSLSALASVMGYEIWTFDNDLKTYNYYSLPRIFKDEYPDDISQANFSFLSHSLLGLDIKNSGAIFHYTECLDTGLNRELFDHSLCKNNLRYNIFSDEKMTILHEVLFKPYCSFGEKTEHLTGLSVISQPNDSDSLLLIQQSEGIGYHSLFVYKLPELKLLHEITDTGLINSITYDFYEDITNLYIVTTVGVYPDYRTHLCTLNFFSNGKIQYDFVEEVDISQYVDLPGYYNIVWTKYGIVLAGSHNVDEHLLLDFDIQSKRIEVIDRISAKNNLRGQVSNCGQLFADIDINGNIRIYDVTNGAFIRKNI